MLEICAGEFDGVALTPGKSNLHCRNVLLSRAAKTRVSRVPF